MNQEDLLYQKLTKRKTCPPFALRKDIRMILFSVALRPAVGQLDT